MNENKQSNIGKANRVKLLKYLTDEDNEWPKRRAYSQEILGYKCDNQIYKTISPEELTEIENEALDIIKSKSSRERKILYESLYRLGKDGSVQAIKEYLDRTEGKVLDRKEITGKDGEALVPILNVTLS